MNFEGLDPSLGEYAAPLHPALDAALELPGSLLPGVELDPDAVAMDAMAVPDPVHLMEGMYSELHTAVSDVGVPVAAAHFDLHEEMLWVGNHGVSRGDTWGSLSEPGVPALDVSWSASLVVGAFGSLLVSVGSL